MTDEWQEFQAYTHFPRYAAAHKRDTSFLGRFTLEMLLNMNKGFAQGPPPRSPARPIRSRRFPLPRVPR